jgi:hypothetical protein
MPSTIPTVLSQSAYGAASDCSRQRTCQTRAANDETARTIRDRPGKTVKTRADARLYMLDKFEARPNYNTWEQATRLLGSPPKAISRQIFALLMEAQLNCGIVGEHQAKA